MRRTWCLCYSIAFTTTVLTCGCTTPTLSGPKTPFENAALNSNAVPTNPANNVWGTRPSAMPTDPYGHLSTPSPATPTNTGGVALASLLQAGKSVSNALKIQPKTSPIVDPVKLDNQPANSVQVAADLHYRAGYFRESQGDFAEAAKHYRNVLEKIPNDVRAVAGYGRVQDQLGNTVEGEQYLLRACELAPQEPAPWNDLAQNHAKKKNLAAAIECQQKTVALQPMNGQYRNSLARLLVDSGRADEAVQQIAAVHGEAMAHFQVGCLLEERHLSDLARRHVEQSLALNPSLAPARQMLDRWQIASTGLPQNDRVRTASATRLPTP